VSFADRRIEFVDRDTAIEQIERIAERGTRFPIVIYGPEGCGKTAFLRQAKIILEEESGYSVVHLNPSEEVPGEGFSVSEELKKLAEELGAFLLRDAYILISKAIEVLYAAVRRGIRKRIALLADDVFQAAGLDRAEQLVKSFLNMIEWFPVEYEKIVVLVSSGEGVTRERIGRHNWAETAIMWNMSKEGFVKLYNLLPDPKLPFEEVWRITGGNPRMLEKLYRAGWDVDLVVSGIIKERNLHLLMYSLDEDSKGVLAEMVEDPDKVLHRLRDERARSLLRELVDKNLVVEVWDRDPSFWIYVPPPEKDLELGIGRYIAWQTPLHREAVRRALDMFRK